MRGSCSVLLLAVCAAIAAKHAAAAEPATSPPREVRVATGHIAPFVLKEDGRFSGFSIDLWDALARRLNLHTAWVEVATSGEVLQAVQSGAADAAIAAITVTREREQLVDFSHPYFDSGLQILVRVQADDSTWSTIRAFFSAAILELIAAALVVLFLLANILWLVERRSNPVFQNGYIAGVLEGLWGSILIIATGEHGDRDTPRWLKRLTVASVWLLGVVLVAQFTATVTSSLTVQQLRSSIQGPRDLPGKRIATVPGTVAADYLTQLGLPYVGVTSANLGCDMVMRGEVQAMVFDAPTLQYWAAKRGNGLLQVVGPLFRPEKYGIAVPSGSPLRKEINEAILGLYEDGEYDRIYERWFSRSG